MHADTVQVIFCSTLKAITFSMLYEHRKYSYALNIFDAYVSFDMHDGKLTQYNTTMYKRG